VTLEVPSPEPTIVEQRVADLLAERLDVLFTDPNTDLFATGLLDSLGFVTLLHAMEQEFGITIDVDDLEIERFRTIASIVAFIGTATARAARDEPRPAAPSTNGSAPE
jgi:D-alanine--poly(phosphoribitol) ligase subunit 2